MLTTAGKNINMAFQMVNGGTKAGPEPLTVCVLHVHAFLFPFPPHTREQAQNAPDMQVVLQFSIFFLTKLKADFQEQKM